MEPLVAILGGGPAGCAAALTLRRYLPDLTTVLVWMQEAGTSAAPSVGETLSPGVMPLLNYLGLHEDFLQAGHLPAGGTASAWGTDQLFERNYIFTGRGAGWHLDRRSFDQWLSDHAEAADARCVRAHAKQVIRTRDRWFIELDGSEPIIADAIIDATGRASWLARRQGCLPRRDDALIGEARWYVHDQPEQCGTGALVETVSDGWWYSATLPGQRAVAMFMTDADLRNERPWEERLVEAPASCARLSQWHATGETAMRPANSQQSPTVTGEGWVSAGDAALAFDPISSLGIGFALRSGMEAARVAAASIEYDDRPAASYADSIGNIYVDYRRRLRRIYHSEGRWSRLPFWERRRG